MPFFEVILNKEHCLMDKHMRVVCRKKEIFLDGRNAKNILFISNDFKDMQMVH